MLHSRGHGIGWYELLQFFIASISIWSLWFTENVYLNKYSERGPADVYTIIMSMLVIGHLATSLTVDWQTTYVEVFGASVPVFISFNGLLITAYGIILIQYLLHARSHEGITGDMKGHMAVIVGTMTLVAVATWITYMKWFDGVYTYAIAYLLTLVLPVVFRERTWVRKMNFPHLVERMQLITILTFGEAVIAVIKTYPLLSDPIVSTLAFLAMAFTFTAYVSQTALNIDHHQQRDPGVMTYVHLGIVTGINLFTVGIESMQHAISDGLTLVLIGLGLFYVGILTLGVYNKEAIRLNKKLLGQYALWVISMVIIILLLPQQLVYVFGGLFSLTFGFAQIGYGDRNRRLYRD